MRIEDPTLAAWTFAYDETEGLMTRQTLPLGRRTDWAYPSAAASDRRGQGSATLITVFADGRGRAGSAALLVTAIERQPETNRPIRIEDPRHSVTEIERTSSGLPVRIVQASGEPEETVTTMEYNAYGQVASVTNPNGNLTLYYYYQGEAGGAPGALREVRVDPFDLDLITRFETDTRGNVTATIDPRGVRHEQVYNALDWPIESRQAVSVSYDGAPPLAYLSRSIYDRNGNLAESEIPFGDGGQSTLVRYEYGELDELLVTRRQIMPSDDEADWVVEAAEYDANLNVIRAIDPEGHIQEVDYDSRNLAVQTRRGLGVGALPMPILEVTVYDPERQPTTRRDGRGNPWQTIYDGYGRVKAALDPLSNRQEVSYDNNGNPVTQRAFDSAGILMADSASVFDRLDRPIESRQWLWQPDPEEPPSAERPESARQLVTKTTYDAASNVVAVEDPLQRTSSAFFDSAERLIKTLDAAGNEQVLTLDASGNATTVRSRELDSNGLLTTVVHTATFDA